MRLKLMLWGRKTRIIIAVVVGEIILGDEEIIDFKEFQPCPTQRKPSRGYGHRRRRRVSKAFALDYIYCLLGQYLEYE